MQLNVKQYETLVKINNIISDNLYSGFDIKYHDTLHELDKILKDVYEKHLESNKKTANYIANKRLSDKNYARSK